MSTGDTYVVLEHEVGKPFVPPDDAAQVVKHCGNFDRSTFNERTLDVDTRRFVLVMWAYPRRTT